MAIKKVCDKCGEGAIEYTGTAYWDVFSQEYIWTIDGMWCTVCKDDVNELKEVEITSPENEKSFKIIHDE